MVARRAQGEAVDRDGDGQIDLGTADEKALVEPLRAYINARAQHLVAIMDCNVTQSQLALASGWDAAAP